MQRLARFLLLLTALAWLPGMTAPSWADDCGECGPGSPPACAECGPAWYLQAEALLLWRDNDAARRPLVVESDRRTELLNARSLDFDLGTGPRLVLGRRLEENRALEAVYFGTHQWNGRAVVSGDNNLSLPDDLGRATLDFDRADRMIVDCRSDLHNAEVHGVWRVDCLEYLAGLRYLRFTEGLTLRGIDGDSGASDYRVGTENRLYGAQLGLRTRRGGERLGLEMGLKLGLFGNDASQATSLHDFDNSFALRGSRTSGAGAALVSDLGIAGTCRLTESLWARAGYNLVWIEGIALAADQLDFTDTPRSGTGLNRDGGVFLHGASVGIEAGW